MQNWEEEAAQISKNLIILLLLFSNSSSSPWVMDRKVSIIWSFGIFLRPHQSNSDYCLNFYVQCTFQKIGKIRSFYSTLLPRQRFFFISVCWRWLSTVTLCLVYLLTFAVIIIDFSTWEVDFMRLLVYFYNTN